MATLFKPTIINYRLANGSYRTADGKRVTSKTPGAVKSRQVSKKYYGRYTDHSGRVVRVPLEESFDISRRALAKIAGDAQLEKHGLDPYAKHKGKPLSQHLEDYRRFLLSKGDGEKHVGNTISRCKIIIEDCRFNTVADLDPSPVVDFLAQQRTKARPRIILTQESYTRRELATLLGINLASVARMVSRDGLEAQGKSKARRFPRSTVEALQNRLCQTPGIATVNHYLTAIKGFTRWLARDHRMAFNPLAHLSKQNPKLDIRRQRRALGEEPFTRFVEATGEGRAFRDITGADRLIIYTLAAQTGFRAGEIASLSPSSFDLNGDPPAVTVEAAYSKRRRQDRQPLRVDVAEMMRQYLAGKPKREKVWPGTWAQRAAEMVRMDLQAAEIAYQDEEGRQFDFHALRSQFISFLAARGVHPKVAQILARHSTITLTMDHYTHLDVFDVAAALDKLPGLHKGKANPPGKTRKAKHA